MSSQKSVGPAESPPAAALHFDHYLIIDQTQNPMQDA